MKTWYIREEQITTKIWEYQVKANTEEEAKELVSSGEVECYNYSDDIDYINNPIKIVEVTETTDYPD